MGAWGTSSPAHLPWARNELSDHLDAMDSNLDNLQTMLTSHGFSVDTSALLDLFSPSVTMPDMSLPDLDSSLASVRRRAGWGAEGAINNPHCVPCPTDSGASVSTRASQAY